MIILLLFSFICLNFITIFALNNAEKHKHTEQKSKIRIRIYR